MTWDKVSFWSSCWTNLPHAFRFPQLSLSWCFFNPYRLDIRKLMVQAKALEGTDPATVSAQSVKACRLYSFGRWPTPASPGKQRAYAKALEAFLAHARLMDPPLEVVRIPFEGSEIVGYLRLPKNAKGPVPLVMAISGLDSRKEDLSENFGVILAVSVRSWPCTDVDL